MAICHDDKRWHRFFECFRSLEEIWNINCDAYKCIRKRKRGWEKLLEVYRAIDKHATIEKVKHRVFNIRSCYRRELKKVVKSQEDPSSEEYVPTLWYFKELDFIRDLEDLKALSFDQSFRVKTERKREDEVTEHELEMEGGMEVPIEQDENFLFEEQMPDHVELIGNQIEEPVENHIEELIPKPKPKRYKLKRKDLHSKAVSAPNGALELTAKKRILEKDEATIYADSWACSYRKLTSEQQLYAKKAIEEILILGQLNSLTLDFIDTTERRTTATKPEFEEIFETADSEYNGEEYDEQYCIEKI